MQFIRNGPDIPEHLLHAHEEGRVVFFCGAGISRPAGLPGFHKLAKRIFKKLSRKRNKAQRAAFRMKRPDIALGLLEESIVGGHARVRRELQKILLNPDLNIPCATETHGALLTLGKHKDEQTGEIQTRLVTTNYDRLFEKVIDENSLDVRKYEPPHLPISSKDWNGLVYLHGLLGKEPTPSELGQLVVSSADIGLAYLTERWASRFVSELFRNYTVCFVGYSINDPILRYITDAFAAERRSVDTAKEIFAFGDYSTDKAKGASEWQAKNVTPILYRDDNQHAYLHDTLRVWADIYCKGVRGKEEIVEQHALECPSASTEDDDFVGRLLWALSDKTGIPARRFADFDPAPSLAWLKSLCKERYGHADLERFGVPPKDIVNNPLKFSLLRRPSPYTLAPWMSLVSRGDIPGADLDKIMTQLARWLVRHLDDPALLLWIVEQGGQLNADLVEIMTDRIRVLTTPEQNGE